MLKQETADHLMSLEKIRTDETVHIFPVEGGRINIDIESRDGREKFVLDVSRQRLNLKKVTYQERYATTEILFRLDLGGGPHRNPDGEEVPVPHLHIYKEGFGDKWAIPAPAELIGSEDPFAILTQFMTYCRIAEPPHIAQGLV